MRVVRPHLLRQNVPVSPRPRVVVAGRVRLVALTAAVVALAVLAPLVARAAYGDTPSVGLVDGKDAAWWARRARSNGRTMRARGVTIRRLTAHRWQPTVTYALRLASSVYGVPEWQLRSVAFCESTLNPYASNGRYRGLFQLGWLPFHRFSPFDPVANALSAAATVVNDHGWRQWSCRP